MLTARGSELELEFGHGVVRQLFEPPLLGAPPGRRDELLAGAAGLAAPLFGLVPKDDAGAGLGVDPTFALMHGLYWLCANLAQDEPLLLAVDDAHWADAASLRVLAYLARRLDELPVVLVCATRPAEPTPQAALVAELAHDPHAVLLLPGPLTTAAVAALVRAGLEGEPDDTFVAACVAATGGTPFLVRELLAALRADETRPNAAYARRVTELGPRAIARSVLLRLGRLEPACGNLARALAVLGADAELRHAAALAGLEPEEAGRAADVLAAAGIVERGRLLQFVHPIVRTAIHADLPASEREARHARAARIFAAEGATPDRVAAHLLAAAPAGDPWAVERLREAASAALAQGAPDSASHYLARALDEPAAPEDRPGLLLDLGAAEVHAGLVVDGAHHLEEALATTDDPGIVRHAGLLHGRAMALQERPRAAIETFDRILERLDPLERDERLTLEAAITAQAQIHSVPAALVAPRLASLRAAAAEGPVPRAALAVLAVDAVFRAAPAAEAADLARRSLEGTPRPFPQAGDPHLLFHACMGLVWAEREAEARTYYDAALEDARRSGSMPRFSAAACGRGLVSYRTGTVAEAEADARLALDAGGDARFRGFYPPFALALLLGSLVERGATDEAERELDAFGPITDERASYSVTLLLLSRARLRRLAGARRRGWRTRGPSAHASRAWRRPRPRSRCGARRRRSRCWRSTGTTRPWCWCRRRSRSPGRPRRRARRAWRSSRLASWRGASSGCGRAVDVLEGRRPVSTRRARAPRSARPCAAASAPRRASTCAPRSTSHTAPARRPWRPRRATSSSPPAPGRAPMPSAASTP